MKTKNLLCLLTILFVLSVGGMNAQTTEFTYQGRLTDGGMPPTGNYDFEFRLYDENSAVIGTVNRNGVAVSSGAFAVGLDFGAQFSGAARSLEIAVRPAGGGAYTTLSPRQPITSAPYSIRSLTAGIADNANQLGGVPSAQFVQTDVNGNVSLGGNLTVGGTLTQAIVNATTEYRINNQRVFSIAGTNNTFVGFEAGLSNTTGEGNSFFGIRSGSANSTGTNNSFFGAASGLTNTTGNANSFFGTSAGRVNTEGGGNSFFGVLAGSDNTTGNSNSFFGTSAGTNNETGNFNAFFGGLAGSNNTTGNENVFIGRLAGSANQTGSNNTLVGFQTNVGANNLNFASAFGAGAIVNNSNSVVLGRTLDTVRIPGNLDLTGSFTGNFTVPAANITGVLSQTNGGTNLSSSGAAGNFLRSDGSMWTSSPILASDLPNLSGSFIQNQTALQTGNFNLSGTGTANIFNAVTQYNLGGLRVLSATGEGGERFGSEGGENLFVGLEVGELNEGGAFNSFFGFRAGRFNTSGSSNAFFGTIAGRQNSTGSANSFFGALSGVSNNADGNSFFGYFAGFANISGSNNSFFGQQAGANSDGSRNTFIGYQAGILNDGEGSNNTLIGANANVTTTPDIFYATAIGADSLVLTSDTIVLGKTAGMYEGELRPADNVIIRGNLVVEGTINGNPIAEQNNAVAEKVQTQETQIKTLQDQNQKQNERLEQQQKQIEQQQLVIDSLRKLLCQTNPNAEICKEIQK